MAEISQNERKTELASRATISTQGTAKANPLKARARQIPPSKQNPNAAKQIERILTDFMKRAKSGKDTGKTPNIAERLVMEQQWKGIDIISDAVFGLLGKDYDLAKGMLHHYFTENGSPRIYQPAEPVQDAIAKRYPAPGQYRNVSGYQKWATSDIRNGLGHFNLDVVRTEDGKLLYFVTDRYEFPDTANGKPVDHGFQVGKISPTTADMVRKMLPKAEFERASGRKDRFELRKDPATGEHTLFIPQGLLADHGTDFESMGVFISPRPNR